MKFATILSCLAAGSSAALAFPDASAATTTKNCTKTAANQAAQNTPVPVNKLTSLTGEEFIEFIETPGSFEQDLPPHENSPRRHGPRINSGGHAIPSRRGRHGPGRTRGNDSTARKNRLHQTYSPSFFYDQVFTWQEETYITLSLNICKHATLEICQAHICAIHRVLDPSFNCAYVADRYPLDKLLNRKNRNAHKVTMRIPDCEPWDAKQLDPKCLRFLCGLAQVYEPGKHKCQSVDHGVGHRLPENLEPYRPAHWSEICPEPGHVPCPRGSSVRCAFPGACALPIVRTTVEEEQKENEEEPGREGQVENEDEE